MKAIAKISKTTSRAQKENALIDIKNQAELTVTLTTCFDYWLQQKHRSKWGRFASVNKTQLRHNF